MKKLLRSKKGFTLIELIVVIAILAILAVILVPSILNYVGEATTSRDQANARSLYSEISLAVATAEDGEVADITAVVTIPDGCSVSPTEIDTETAFTVTCGEQTFDGSSFTE